MDLNNIIFVENYSQLLDMKKLIQKNEFVSFDLEANGLHRYPEKVCLLQFATDKNIYLVDPLIIEDISPLREIFVDDSIQKIIHASGYDIRCLDRDWGFRIKNIFDTSIAASFIGSNKLGLNSLLNEHLSLNLPENKIFQKADWTNRPLSKDLIKYASEDVLYLKTLRDILINKLDKLGRLEWVIEEFHLLESIRYEFKNEETAYLSIKGTGVLDSRSLTILSCLYKFRDLEARRRDKPPFKIISDRKLVEMSNNWKDEIKKLDNISFKKNAFYLRLFKAFEKGINCEIKPRPKVEKKIIKISHDDQINMKERLHHLKSWRNRMSKKLNIAPSLVWPLASLNRLSKKSHKFELELFDISIRDWQKKIFSKDLDQFLSSLLKI
ncbi:MAG: hypothetical protein CL758_09130 [Chloroflexi bacterium]|nr:hypothetical protein [Chloroflexota bacterium]|tara:strand:+ start:52 stop:1197 length:1146 start_codon:yes stop_codon:yes gene_type:complete